MKLYDFFCNSADEDVMLPWKIYNASDHNRVITPDYGELPCSELPELDDSKVISHYKRKNKDGDYMAVYIVLTHNKIS